MRFAIIETATNDVAQVIDIDFDAQNIDALKQHEAFADEAFTQDTHYMIEVPDDYDGALATYNPSTGEFEAPEVVETRNAVVTRLQLIQRLQQQEKALLIRPDKVQGLTDEVEIALSIFAEEIKLANEIDLDDPEIVAGLEMLEQTGLIASGRANEIRGVE